MARRKAKYNKSSESDVTSAANRRSSSFRSILKNGIPRGEIKADQQYHIRVLPSTWKVKKGEAKSFAFEIFVHRNVGPDKETILCPKKTFGDKCAVCDAVSEAQREGRGDEEWITKVKVGPPRYAFYYVNLKTPDLGPQFWDAPSDVNRGILKEAQDQDEGAVDVADLEEGYGVKFRTVQKGKEAWNRDYEGFKLDKRPTNLVNVYEKQGEDDLADEAWDKWTEFIEENPIPDVLQVYPYEEISALLMGVGSSDDELEDEDDEEDVAPRRRNRTKSKGRKAKSRDEDEEEDEDDEDDEDVTPRRRGRKKREPLGTKEPEDDELDQVFSRGDDDEDDDEEKPKRRGRKKKATKKSRKRDPEPDEDEEDDEEVRAPKKRRPRKSSEDDDDSPKSKRRSRKGKGAEDDEEDDEEEPRKSRRSSRRSRDDEDDEEPEEKPKRRGRKKKEPEPVEDDDYEDDDEDDDPPPSKVRRARRGR